MLFCVIITFSGIFSRKKIINRMSKKATKGTLHICVLIRHVGVAKRITDVATEEYSLNVLLIVNI